jgi:23S rRNA (uracil1939-C5)-methyltransferase
LTDFSSAENLARLYYKGELVVQHKNPQVCFSKTWVDASALGFLQASDQADAYLTQSLLEVLPQTCDKALDLFCGRGLFSFALATRARTVFSYDNDEAALLALARATRPTPGSPIKAHTRHLFNDPLSQKELMGAQVVVLDPPRVGALAQCRTLADSKVPLLIYVSCNPETFARDARVLQTNYQLRLIQPLDQFLWSPHIELIAVFDLK